MIKIEKVETVGWEHAIRGMRNPLNSWDKSDTSIIFYDGEDDNGEEVHGNYLNIGENDYNLMTKLRNAGTDHRKFMRMITAYADITAPLYWWKEFDTYRFGVEKNSCSTMHTIHKKEFAIDDFSHEHIQPYSRVEENFKDTIDELNFWREVYLNGGMVDCWDGSGYSRVYNKNDKEAWNTIIQLLPSSYNQKRTVMMSYEALANMYHARKKHKLDEWREFCEWIKNLPYSELITGEE